MLICEFVKISMIIQHFNVNGHVTCQWDVICINIQSVSINMINIYQHCNPIKYNDILNSWSSFCVKHAKLFGWNSSSGKFPAWTMVKDGWMKPFMPVTSIASGCVGQKAAISLLAKWPRLKGWTSEKKKTFGIPSVFHLYLSAALKRRLVGCELHLANPWIPYASFPYHQSDAFQLKDIN